MSLCGFSSSAIVLALIALLFTAVNILLSRKSPAKCRSELGLTHWHDQFHKLTNNTTAIIFLLNKSCCEDDFSIFAGVVALTR